MALKSSWWFNVALIVTGLLPAVAAADDKELVALAGEWKFQAAGASGEGWRQASAFMRGGRNSDEVGFKWELYTLEVKGNTFRFAGTEAGKATAKIDPTRSPKWIDLRDSKGRTWPGVYELRELRGHTVLIITLGLGKTRPTKVVIDGHAHAVYTKGGKPGTLLLMPAERAAYSLYSSGAAD